MVLQKRLEYGFNGYQIPSTPRAPRSSRRRGLSWKKAEDKSQTCAFDLLATVAGKLLKDHHTYRGPSDCSEKVKFVNGESRIVDFSVEKVKASCSCKVEDGDCKEMINEETSDGKPRLVNNLDNNNVNLVSRDDDENSRALTFNGDRRIRRFLASKYCKEASKLNDNVHLDTDAELKPIYCNKKTCYERQHSLRDYPFKKRRLYELEDFSNSDGCISPEKDSIDDSHVKLKIKSFRVPELFVELPETATIGSLKRTVMEAVNAILRSELHVGVMLQGKKIRDDNKTLLQTGIYNKLDALGFSLEPNHLQVPDPPKTLTRYRPTPNVAVRKEVSVTPPNHRRTSLNNIVESNHDSATPSPRDTSVDCKNVLDSRALVTVPPTNQRALAMVPMRKSKRPEAPHRRIRRPFSVSEVEGLVQAVEKFGTGRWRDVKLRAFDNAKHRTYVDLKDKWKTLVHTARISPQQRRGEPVPQELLDRVLAAHAYWSHHQPK